MSTQTSENKKNQDILSSASRVNKSGISKNIENLSTIIKLARSKKSNLTKSKKSDLAKTNSFKMDFLTFGAKKVLILKYFNSK